MESTANLTGNNDVAIRLLIDRIRKEFAIKDLGKLGYFLGLEVTYPSSGLFLSQSKYARDILIRAELLDSKPVATCLAFGASFTAADIAYTVSTVSQFQQNPKVDHFQAVKRILRYIKGTISHGLLFSPGDDTLLGYSDVDWARCIDTRRSTYGYSIFIGSNLVSWSAKKQPTVSRSSCESEYRAMASAASKMVWVSNLLRDLHSLPKFPPMLLSDNKSALFLYQNFVSHKRAKHIDIDCHFIRELIESGKLKTQFVPFYLQLADVFTKSLARAQLEYFRSKLRVLTNPTLCLRGG
ncbi:uncharacterized mitochondrial protein AtMg00810-like [Andrographis paniculata]|uniref:uncharacterized mitochondrial protein AtMg00810-like n=1 Tax=Andrographis paniculata TaxID=175694 RepID=UPI0021E9AB49|nr:uncharacterized mitochondrial protein AtMg00810-like [Andrographis paniculata]